MPILFNKCSLIPIWPQSLVRFHGIDGLGDFIFGHSSGHMLLSFLPQLRYVSNMKLLLSNTTSCREKPLEKAKSLILKDSWISWPSAIRKTQPMDFITPSPHDSLSMEESRVLVPKLNPLLYGLLTPKKLFLEKNLVVVMLEGFFQVN